jgi:2-C-methyl-D-erythritol 4-phosphate cytidylyltransferase
MSEQPAAPGDTPSIDGLGWVPTTGRGPLPFAMLDGEPLVALASFALEDAGAELVDFDADLAESRRAGDRPLVLHDPLCPLTPIWFLRRAAEVAQTEDVVVVGVHPVTDTVKATDGELLGQTVDREGLWTLASPVVLPASLVATLDGWPDDDLVALVQGLQQRGEVRFLEAPPMARRVEDESSLRLLEALAAEARAQQAG